MLRSEILIPQAGITRGRFVAKFPEAFRAALIGLLPSIPDGLFFNPAHNGARDQGDCDRIQRQVDPGNVKYRIRREVN